MTHRRIDGLPFTLDRFTPLREIYADDHPHICIKKPAQRGVSEYAINVAAFALDRGAVAWDTRKNGLNVGYLFPTVAALSDFSKERISGLATESPYLGKMFGGQNAFAGIHFKQFGNSYLYLRGAWSESALLSFACDVLILDEYDRMDSRAVALARRRLNASVVRREIDISTPTIPGKAIDALYLQSDRRIYEQECPRCGQWMAHKFHRDVRADNEDWSVWKKWEPATLRLATMTLHCPACRGIITDAERINIGRWTAREPGNKSLRGYHVPALPFPMTDLTRLAVAAVSEDPGEQTEFWRSDLGEAFDAAGARITEAMLLLLSSNLADGLAPRDARWHQTTMGVDVGARFHFRITSTLLKGFDSESNIALERLLAASRAAQGDLDVFIPSYGQRIVRLMGTCGSWAELSQLMMRFQVARCIVDAQPELHGARAWAKRFPGRVFRATYPSSNAVSARLFVLNEKDQSVQINRTMALDGVFAAVAGMEESWPEEYCRDREVVEHMTAPVRVVAKDDNGQEITSWQHAGPDHFMHACGYDRVALATLLEYPGEGKAGIFAQGSTQGWSGARRSGSR